MSGRFPFVQLEFAHSIGPPAGRYLVRREGAPADDVRSEAATPGDAAAGEWSEYASADVLVVQVRGAPPPKPGRLRRSARPEPNDAPARELSLTVATIVWGTRVLSDTDAPALIVALQGSDDERERWTSEALAVLNRAIRAYRACAADPYVVEATRLDPRAVRIGHGTAKQVFDGRWEAAVSAPAPRTPRMPRTARLLPTQGMAAVLGGHAGVLESEELVLRVVLDLEHERPRAAAVGLEAAIPLLVSELSREALATPVRARLDKVTSGLSATRELAERARSGPLAEGDVRRLRELTEDVGELVDLWRYEQPVTP